MAKKIKAYHATDVYAELDAGKKWCFKFQPKGKPIIICSHDDKEVAAKMMIEELIKRKACDGHSGSSYGCR